MPPRLRRSRAASSTSAPVLQSIAPTGTVLSDPLGVPYPGVPAPTNVRFSSFDTSYWSETVTTILRPDETVTVDIAALRRCAGAIVSGTVVNALTQAPIPNARTSWGPTIEESVFTDAQGQYVTPESPVGFKNGPNQIQLGASAAGFNPQRSIITAFCGGHITVDFGRPATGVGNIEGHVTNADTGHRCRAYSPSCCPQRKPPWPTSRGRSCSGPSSAMRLNGALM